MTNNEMENSLLEYSAYDVQQEGWKVDSMSAANWAIEKIRSRRAEIEELKKFAAAKKAQIDSWLEEQTDSLQDDIDFFEAKLKPFVADMLQGKKSKTMKFPCGSCSFKKTAPKFTKDEEVLTQWVLLNEKDYINTKYSVNWADFKKTLQYAQDGKMITADGEVVPGVTYTVEEDSFTVKTEV